MKTSAQTVGHPFCIAVLGSI